MTVRQPVSLRIPAEAHRAIHDLAKRSGRDFSSVANEMLTEAIKLRRVPGIVFSDGPIGRCARIAGTGIDVFEIAKDYRHEEQDWERLRTTYHWLSEQHLRAALAYAEAYPEEIEDRLREEERWTSEELWKQYPFTSPRTSK